MKPIAPARLVGVAIAIPAGLVAAGWLLRDPALVRLVPGATMVFNTALNFLLVALALLADSLPPAWRKRVRTVAGGIILLIALLVFSEHVSDHSAGVDWPALHRWLIDSNAHPGRMSLPTTAAFLLCGITLLLLDRVRGLWPGVAVQTLSAAIVAIGAIGLTGYVLDLPRVYRHYLFSQMAASTSVAIIAAGIGMWLCWRVEPWYRDRRLILRDEHRIAVNGAVVLVAIVFASVLATFAVMRQFTEALATENMLQQLKGRKDILTVSLALRSTRAELIATRPALTELAETLDANLDVDRSRSTLQARAESFMPVGITGLSITSPEGVPWVNVGAFATNSSIELPIRGPIPATLLWDNGFVLRVRMPMLRDGRTVAFMIAEQSMPDLTAAFSSADDYASGETVICVQDEGHLFCISPRLKEATFTIPYVPTLPMARALAGETGAATSIDYRDENVVAAYGPVGATGLGIVDKVDTAELYAPLRARLYIIMAALIMLVAAGVAVLYRTVAPLARELALGKQRLQLALASSHLALWDWDAGSDKVYLSEEWEQLLGRAPRATAVSMQDLRELVHPDDRSAVTEHLRALLSDESRIYDIEHRVRAENGSWTWLRSRGKVVQRGRGGRPMRIVGTNADITVRKSSELHLAHRANHDTLTELPNRALFHDRLDRAVERSRRNQVLMAAMYLDIDKFKPVNDTLGHDVGDALLKQISARLSASVRATDTVARLGGDEFAIVLEGLATTDDGFRTGNKIVAAMRTPFVVGEHTLSVTTSVGIAFYAGQPGIESSGILKSADEALYRAKAEGRDRIAVADTPAAAPAPERVPSRST